MDISNARIEGALGRYSEGVGLRAAEQVQVQGNESFASALNTQTTKKSDAEQTRSQKAHKAAGDLVSNALILPVLKQVRRGSGFGGGLFRGGIGEKTFGPEFDMQLADRIARSPKMQGISNALAERMISRGKARSKTTGTGGMKKEYGVDIDA